MTEEITVRLNTTVMRTVALNIPCDWCRARPGDVCRKPDGEPIYEEEGLPALVHIHRAAPVWVIYKIGYQHGRRDMKEE